MKIGFIGTGKIGKAIILGLLNANVAKTDIFIYDGGHKSAQAVADELQLQLIENYSDFIGCDAVIVAVGSPANEEIFVKLSQVYHGIIISTGGGDLLKINQKLASDSSFVKVVPNTPVQLGEGITAISFKEDESKEVINNVKALFAKLGDVYVVSEKLLGIYGTIAGCTPAYIDLLIEALSDAAVENGVKRSESYRIIEKMLLGTAKLALTSQKLPEELKDEVTTPGGSTIKGVNKLEEKRFRGTLIAAINASMS